MLFSLWYIVDKKMGNDIMALPILYNMIIIYSKEKRGTVTNKNIQVHLELKSTSVVNYLKEMLELELIEKVREGRNLSYKIK